MHTLRVSTGSASYHVYIGAGVLQHIDGVGGDAAIARAADGEIEPGGVRRVRSAAGRGRHIRARRGRGQREAAGRFPGWVFEPEVWDPKTQVFTKLNNPTAVARTLPCCPVTTSMSRRT